MFTKALATLSVATMVAIGGASVVATAADAHQRNTPANQSFHTDEVWVGNEFVGRDTDPNVRLDLRRTYGNIGG
jgi:hypothetical protein